MVLPLAPAFAVLGEEVLDRLILLFGELVPPQPRSSWPDPSSNKVIRRQLAYCSPYRL